MSSIPGYTLEPYLAWHFGVVVEDQPENNVSVGIAEMLGTAPQRHRLTLEEMAQVVELYEPYREVIENRLADFDEENQSWRGYCFVMEYDIPDEVSEKALALVKSFTQAKCS